MSSPPHYRWSIVALTLVNQALALGIIIYSFALFVVPWLGHFELARSQVMLAILAFQVATGLLSPILGRLMDQFVMRRLVITGAVSMGLGLGLLSQATQFWQIILVYCTLLPIGMLFCGTLASQTMVSKWFTGNRGLAIGLSAMGTSIGGLIIPIVVVTLIARYEWQGALLFLSVVSTAILIPLNLLVLRFEPPLANQEPGADQLIDSRTWTSREILTSKAFWIPVVALIPINAAFVGVQFNLGAYMADLGHDPSLAAKLIAVTSFMMIVGKLFFGTMGDRIDHRILYWTMALLMIVALVFYEGSPGKLDMVIAAGIQGFATGGVMPMMGIIYSVRFGTLSFGRVLGYVNLVIMLGGFGSIFSGWIFDSTHSYDVAFWVFMGLILPGIIIMFFLPPPEAGASMSATKVVQH
ncbi:MAG: MFS transporter [Gammaproteobacteria bacterium]|nr:MFS transporter [Gammaproteobacteria bacterium]